MLPETSPAVLNLLSRVPLAARVVLHVGCGDGTLGDVFRRVNPTARLLGIELNQQAADIAAERMDEVVVGDVETDPLPFEIPDGIDCIIYGGVLGHLRDPWTVIQRHAQALSPDGVMVLHVPNVEHWSVADRLLRGAWDCGPTISEDRQRRFGLEGMHQRLMGLGLSLCDIQAQGADNEAAQQFAAALAPGLAALGIDPAAYARRAAPASYMWRIRREPRQRMFISGNMMAPVGGVSHVRVMHPLQAMGSDPMVTTNLTNVVDTQRPTDEAPRIFVLHRPSLIGAEGWQLLRVLIDAGWLVVTEFDDHPDFFRGMIDEAHVVFSGVHAVQTSTPALAQVLRERNPEVAIFPNAIAHLPEVRNFADPRAMTLFFGALNREQDWAPLMPAINAVAEKVGDRLRFQVVHDASFFDALETPHKNFTPTCDYETYLTLLGQSEISFMPLGDNGFNRAKSDLKFIEAGACRVAPLASTVVYGDSIEDGRTGLLFRDADDLHARLLRLIAMPELAQEVGDAARAYVSEERMLAYQVAPRLAWYRSLWARREALTAALNARMTSAGVLAA